MRTRIRGRGLVLGLSVLLGAGAIVVNSVGSAAAAGTFAPGDIVVYRVGDGSTALSSNATAVFLDDYTPAGTLVQSIPLPTTASGANKPLVASGTATSEGLLTLSGDGRFLVAPGYDTAVGTAKISSSTSAAIPRTVAVVDSTGAVDTSTALTDFSTGNNPRSATSTNGTDLWVGGAAGGPRYTTIGASTSTELDSGTFKNVRQVEVADGQLYASADPTKAGLTIGTVGSGTPTAPVQPVTNLPFATPPGDPYAYALLTLGDGTTPDTLYEADLTAGAVVKYGLVSGVWTAEGSVLVPSPGGLTANDDNGTVTIYATSSGPAGTAGTIYKITDSTGVGGVLSGSAATIATLPANEAVRGVAFAPGTVIGTGGGVKPPVILPTITTPRTGLPAAIGDPTNPTLPITIGDDAFDPAQLTVTATAADTSIATAVSVDGTGANRTLTVTPGVVGKSVITLTVTAPDATSASVQITYGLSAAIAGSNFYSGAANASAAISVGNGYALVGDDENDVIRLYNLASSGAPAATFDFTSQLPFGPAEVDIEAASRQGDMIYWEGSMSTSDSGDLAPSRSTVFATEVSGSGADTTLTYAGSYTGLLSDLVAWDVANGNTLGLADSAAEGVSGHASNALNVEGMSIGSDGTAYLAFRAPLEPTTDRHLAMLIPVTNFTSLTSGGTHATFGTPIFFDLGGLGIRDIKANADGQYLIIAGTADDANSSFVLYEWDGVPAHAPRKTGVTLPVLVADGSWETLVDVPDPLVAGAPVRLIQDDGDADFYGDGLTSKTGEITDLQKNIGITYDYAAPALLATGTTVTSSANPAAPGKSVTLTATVTGPADQATPSGNVAFSIGCASVPLVNGVATCTLPAGALQAAGSPYSIVASYGGNADFAPSTATLSQAVTGAPTSTSAAALTLLPLAGRPVTIAALVLPTKTVPAQIGGTVTFTLQNSAGTTVFTTTSTLGQLPLAGGTIPGSVLATAGKYTVTVRYSGDEFYSPSTTTVTLQIRR